MLISSFVLLLLLFIAAIYGLQQNAIRISQVDIIGADPALATYARSAMQGSYFGLIPRDSIFFFPEERIRSSILSDHGDIAAVSIFQNGFTGIVIKVDNRTPIARWCGDATRFNLEDSDLRLNLVAACYIFDANGVIFAAAATTSETVNPFALYAPLAGDTLEPLQATIADAEKLPAVFDFARQLATFGSPVTHIVIAGGEVSDTLASGTRVTYVLGNEQNAFTALVSARKKLNLADGSIDYVDLRFDGKVYPKRKE